MNGSYSEGDVVMPSWKPEGYTSAAPYLVVANAAASIEFLKAAFDAVALRRFEGPNGAIMHAEVRIDDTVVMLSDGSDGWPSIQAHVHIYVPDVDLAYERALAAGAVSVMPPAKKDDADKRGGVKDPGGTTWWIATQMES
jgi:PhnB protein